jgi:ethanolamine utilization protein EutN
VGAGIGERVLVVQGSTARAAARGDGVPVDAAIVGIVDALEFGTHNE